MAAVAVPQVQFSDLDRLRALVTDEYGAWGPALEVTQPMIDAFADVSGDRQWIHVDVERCETESPFGAPIAHGFLTLSIFPRLSVRAVELTGHGSAVNYGIDRLRFLSPVRVGDRIHGRARVAAVEPRGPNVLVTTDLEVRGVEADRPAVLCSMLALYLPPGSDS